MKREENPIVQAPKVPGRGDSLSSPGGLDLKACETMPWLEHSWNIGEMPHVSVTRLKVTAQSPEGS